MRSLLNKLNLRCVLVAAIIASAAALILQIARMAEDEAKASRCRGRLLQIGHAIQSYYDENCELPKNTNDVPDSDLQVCWRVALLKYLDDGSIVSQYDYDKKWCDTVNIHFADGNYDVARRFQWPDIRSNGGGPHFYFIPECLCVCPSKIARGYVSSERERVLILTTTGFTKYWTDPTTIDCNLSNEDLARLIPDNGAVLTNEGSVITIRNGRCIKVDRIRNWNAR